jgi:hypothetical protein
VFLSEVYPGVEGEEIYGDAGFALQWVGGLYIFADVEVDEPGVCEGSFGEF